MSSTNNSILAVTVAICLQVGAINAPARDLWVDASAAAAGDGGAARPFRAIQQAALVAQAGDTVHVRPGVYRERVMPERGGEPGRPIIYISETPHAAIVKGSDVFAPAWRDDGRGLYSGELDERQLTDRDYVDGGNPYRIAYEWDKDRHTLPPHPFKSVQWTLGQVFVDSAPLRETSSREELTRTRDAWWFDAAVGRIMLNLGGGSPRGRLVELTVRRGVFRPKHKGLGFIEVRGFVFEHCANQFPAQFWALPRNAQSGMVGTRGGHHWVIANNVIRHAKSVGLTFGTSGGSGAFDNETPQERDPARQQVGYHLIENNVFSSNGAIGAMGNGHTGVIIRDNLFERNNALQNTAYETGGIKTHAAFDTRIEHNRFVDNDCMGIWLDNTWKNARVSRNLFLGNRGKDIFFEMDDNAAPTAALVDANIFLPSRPELIAAPKDAAQPLASPWKPWSASIYGHDASGIRITRNLFASGGYGLYFRKITSRKGGAANLQATGNLFAGEKMTAVCLPLDNPPFVQNNQFNWNVYPASPHPFVLTGWSHPKGWTDPDAVARILTLWKSNGAHGENPESFRFGDSTKPPAGYHLAPEQWRAVTGFDADSLNASIQITVDREHATLMLTLPPAVAAMKAPREAGLECDYFGRPFPATGPAGPFAELKPGRQQIMLPPLRARETKP